MYVGDIANKLKKRKIWLRNNKANSEHILFFHPYLHATEKPTNEYVTTWLMIRWAVVDRHPWLF